MVLATAIIADAQDDKPERRGQQRHSGVVLKRHQDKDADKERQDSPAGKQAAGQLEPGCRMALGMLLAIHIIGRHDH